MRHQSIAKRKQTTASPEKTPMKTDRIRKKVSSRKIPRSRSADDRSGSEATASVWITPACEFSSLSKSIPFVHFRDQQQRQVLSRRGPASRAGLAFDAEHQIHGGLHQIRVSLETPLVDLPLHRRPLFTQIPQRSRPIVSRAIQKPLPGNRKSLYDKLVAFRDRNWAAKWIHLQHQSSGLEAGGALCIAGVGGYGILEVPVRQFVAAKLECGSPCRCQYGWLLAIHFQTQVILGERMVIILRPKKEVSGACVLRWIVTEIRRQCNQFRLCLCFVIDAEQVFDQLQADVLPLCFLVAGPN